MTDIHGLTISPEFNTVAFSPTHKPAIPSTSPGVTLQNALENKDFLPLEPVRLFDDLYYVGTELVGSLIFDTGAGLIMLDTGCKEKDGAQFTNDMKKLGLDPSDIKLIVLSHEHIDHYGGTQYLISQVCPGAKVAMSLVGWNNMQTRPAEMAYDNPRPKTIDIYLVDGQKIRLGNIIIDVIFTPGHSPGCLSFIFPVKDNGKPHMAGLMGGNMVPTNWNEAFLYYSSIDYFMGHTRKAGCDVGLRTHARDMLAELDMLRTRKLKDPNPLIIGEEKFETVYIQKYRDLAFARFKQLPPEEPPEPPRRPG